MKKSLLVILIMILVLCCVGCTQHDLLDERFCSTAFFGTYVEVFLQSEGKEERDRQNLQNAKAEIEQTLIEISTLLDADKPTGDVYRFNALARGESIEVSDIFAECFKVAKQVYDLTDGAYNPAVYSLVDLWGFSSRVLSNNGVSYPYDRPTQSIPQDDYVTAFKSLTDFGGIRLDKVGEKYFVTKPNDFATVGGDDSEYTLKIDFGGIAKGFAGDKIKEIADKYGIKKGYFMIGQSSITFLDSADQKGYDLDMENPIDTSSVLFTKKGLKNTSISVSGDYQRYFEQDGKKYCHIIDAQTGYPVDGQLKAVFLVCKSSAICDALTTALMTYDVQKIAKLSQSQEFFDLGVSSVVMVLKTQNGLQVVSNAKDIDVNSGVKRLKFSVDQQGVEFFGSMEQSLLPIAILLVVAVVVCLAVFGVKKSKKQKQYSLKTFLKGDLVVYTLLVVVVALTFLIPIKNGNQKMQKIEVYCGEDLVLVYDVNGNELNLKSVDWLDAIKIETKDNKIIATVYFDKDYKQYNVIEFFDGQAKMVKATCVGKDCTKTFNSVHKANQVVVCMPHTLRLVGVGDGNLGVK